MQDFEKLGAFYLGKRFDHAADEVVADEYTLYDSNDLIQPFSLTPYL